MSASFTLSDNHLRLTEEQATGALEHLAGRLGRFCRSYPLKKTRIFLYPAGVTAGESANWIGGLEDSGSRKIDFHSNLLKDERGDRYACLAGKEHGIGPNHGTKLPSVRQREVIGTWAKTDFNLTMSLERVKGKVYKVYRSPYCSSGDRGQLLQTRSQGRYAVIGSANGDYYQVTGSGDLGVFDHAGSVDALPEHVALPTQYRQSSSQPSRISSWHHEAARSCISWRLQCAAVLDPPGRIHLGLQVLRIRRYSRVRSADLVCPGALLDRSQQGRQIVRPGLLGGCYPGAACKRNSAPGPRHRQRPGRCTVSATIPACWRRQACCHLIRGQATRVQQVLDRAELDLVEDRSSNQP